MSDKRKPIEKGVFLLLLPGILLFFLLCFSFRSLACPAEPGGDEENVPCPSVAGEELITVDRLKEVAALRAASLRAASLSGEFAENDSDLPKRISGEAADSVPETETSLPLLCIVIGFSEGTENMPDGMSYEDSFDWGENIFRSENSLSRYYRDMSLGKFTFTPVEETSAFGVGGNTATEDRENDGIVHVTVDQAHQDWATISTGGYIQQADVYYEALMKSQDYVDYSAYDADGNGRITRDELAVAFIVAGYNGASVKVKWTKGKENYLWAYAWDLQSLKNSYYRDYVIPNPDGVQVTYYICMPEQTEPVGEELIPAHPGTLAHELGHYLGLPDLYDTGNSNTELEWNDYKVQYMSLMDQGCWGIGSDGNPVTYSMDVWSRCRLGWLPATEVDMSILVFADGDDYSETTDNPRLFRINTDRENEYFLLENHRFSGWDSGMANGISGSTGILKDEITDGIVIWHIDEEVIKSYESKNKINNRDHRPGIMPLYPEVCSDGEERLISDSDGKVILNPFIALVDSGDDERDEGSSGSGQGPQKLTVRLPIYGEGEDADLRSARKESCITVTIDGGSADEMEVDINLDAHIPAEEPVIRNKTLPSGEEPGGYDEVTVCGICGKEISKVHRVIYPEGWQKIDGKWYYFDGEGKLICRKWINRSGKWYYLREDGVMATGWQKVMGKWYYLTPGSGVMKTGWLKLGSAWYYLGSDGAMQTGWIRSGGKWYYLFSNGRMAAEEYVGGYRLTASGAWDGEKAYSWHKSSRGWWYADPSGRYLSGVSVKIDGKKATFDQKGYWTGS